MMGKVIFCFLLTVAVKLLVVVAHQADIQLGGAVTLPCQDNHHKTMRFDLLDIQWWTGEHLVMHLQLGRMIQGSRYINRAYFSAEGLRNGDFSLSITHTEYSDSGRYRCLLTIEGQKMALGEVDLEVKVPRSQSALFVESGNRAVLSCFGSVDWSGSEAAFVQWKRWAQVVLQWKSGSLFVDPMFEGRVSVPKERIVHGDISLIFNQTFLHDDGYYVCFFKKNDDIRPSTTVNLTITEKMSTVNKTSGSQLQLPLPNESPVTLSFLPDGGNYTVSVCEVERRQLTCFKQYSNRTRLENNSLILTNLTSAESGVFVVREKGTSRTRNVVILQIYTLGTEKVTFTEVGGIAVGASVSVLLMGLAGSGYFFYKQRKLNKVPKQRTGQHMENKYEDGSEHSLWGVISHDESVNPCKNHLLTLE